MDWEDYSEKTSLILLSDSFGFFFFKVLTFPVFVFVDEKKVRTGLSHRNPLFFSGPLPRVKISFVSSQTINFYFSLEVMVDYTST